MSNTIYQLTQQIQTLVQEKAKKHGLELEIESDYFVSEDNKIYHNYMFPFDGEAGDFEKNLIQSSIQEPQIRQILMAFQDQFGIKVDKFEKNNLSFVYNQEGKLINSKFTREPVTVLHELITILESI